MRYGVSMLQVVRVHPELVEGQSLSTAPIVAYNIASVKELLKYLEVTPWLVLL